MDKAMHKLTDTAIRGALKPGKYGDGGGLWLLVGPTGAEGRLRTLE
jgi:hypothetical protein